MISASCVVKFPALLMRSKRPEEGFGFPGAGLTPGYENLTWALGNQALDSSVLQEHAGSSFLPSFPPSNGSKCASCRPNTVGSVLNLKKCGNNVLRAGKSAACRIMLEEDPEQAYENVLAEIQSFELPIEATLSILRQSYSVA
ncbi:hypothetical protein STEG23_002066 [Scotinomys teguina]